MTAENNDQFRHFSSRGGIASLIERLWIWPVAAIALVSAAVFALRFPPVAIQDHSHDSASQPSLAPPVQARTVVYQITTPLADHGTVSYLDERAHTVTKNVSFPWETTLHVTVESAPVSVAAQAHGGQLQCRILVDGEEKNSSEITAPHPAVNCSMVSI